MATLNASLNTAIARLGTFRTRTSEAARSARDLATGSAAAEREVKKSADTAATGGGLFTKLKTGLGLSEEGMKGLNGAMKANAIGLLLTLLAPLIQKFTDMIMNSKAVQAAIQIAFKIIGDTISTVSKFVKGVFDVVWPYVWGLFKSVIGNIVTEVKSGFEIVKNLIMIPMNYVKGEIKVTWDIISGIFQIAMDLLTGKVGKAWGDIKKMITSVVNDVHDTISSVWGGLANIAKAAFQAVLAAVRDPINAIIGLVNRAIDGLDSVHISIPSWVPGIGGKSFGVNIPHIPTLADGGIVLPRPGGTLALVGEGGQSEAVLPLSKLSAMLAGARGPVLGAAGAAGGGFTVTNYYEANNGSARRTAEELMFLAKARG
ncbi:hypothetical protein [Catenulispora rubra]|uniref:hypothetical protein n=1 Tax=Catenulispora rubra TaxID=280293 RepID=UPI00189249BB|nr:hypothetical protein [Catenulispora rubra]